MTGEDDKAQEDHALEDAEITTPFGGDDQTLAASSDVVSAVREQAARLRGIAPTSHEPVSVWVPESNVADHIDQPLMRQPDARAVIADQGIANQVIADQVIADERIADQGIAGGGIADERIADQGIAGGSIADQVIADERIAGGGIADEVARPGASGPQARLPDRSDRIGTRLSPDHASADISLIDGVAPAEPTASYWEAAVDPQSRPAASRVGASRRRMPLWLFAVLAICCAGHYSHYCRVGCHRRNCAGHRYQRSQPNTR